MAEGFLYDDPGDAYVPGYDPDYDFELDEYDVQGDDWENNLIPPEEETSFIDNLPDVPGTPVSLAKQEKINSFYKFLEDNGYNVDKNAPLDNGALFKMNEDKQLAVDYKGKLIRLTLIKDSKKFLSPKTLASIYGKGGVAFVRDVLGITKVYNPVSAETRQQADKFIKFLNAEQENIEMQTVEKVEEDLNNFLETSAQTELTLSPEGSLPFRELAGLDRSLRNMRTSVQHLIGEREAKKARVQELKDETSRVSYEDGEVQFDENLQEKQKEIKTLEEQIELLDSEIREYDGKFRSQFQRIKQTIDKMVNKDMTLSERIQTLFREQGITIVSILTALALAISTIATSIELGIKAVTPTPKPVPPKPPRPPGPDPGPDPRPDPRPGTKEWIKNMLQKITNLLIKIGDKALLALPGVIGAVINFLLKSAASVVGFVAENLWTLLIAISGLLYFELRPASSKIST